MGKLFYMAEKFVSNFEFKYKYFMLARLICKAKEYAEKYDITAKILNADYLGSYFLGLLEVGEKYFLSIDNVKNPKIVDINLGLKKDDYCKSRKSFLRKNCPPKLFDKLIEQGLYEDIEAGKNDIDSPFLLHRLCLCISENIIGLRVHHRNKKTKDNFKSNLEAVTRKKHEEYHKYEKRPV